MSVKAPYFGVVLVTTFVVLATAASAAGIQPPRAAPVTGKEIRISPPPSLGDDVASQVAFNTTDEEYLVVWSDERSSPAKVYGRRLAADGTPRSGGFRISGPASTSHEFTPDVAWNATRNEYLVVWADERDAWSRGRDIYGRRLKATGAAIGDDFLISGDAAEGHDFSPAVAWNPATGRYLVVWQDSREFSNRNWDVYGRLITALGAPRGNDFRISVDGVQGEFVFATAIEEIAPDVAADTLSGGFLVAWQDDRHAYAADGYDIRARRVTAGGKNRGTDFRVNRLAAGHQQSPAVAWNEGAAEFLVVWQDGRSFFTRCWDIFGRRVSADGTRPAGDIRVTSQAPEGQHTPDVAFDPGSGQYLVVWEDWRNYATRTGDTFARRLAADGARVGGEFRVCGPGAGENEDDPAVAYGSARDEFLVVWSDWRWDDSRGQEIVGRRVAG
ncbi:MAG: hypothetical protein JW785_08695 [Acidimicrobiia bacterium]|nr:hypothetical protein [Acidimicrobiia bacterium]